MLNGWTFYLFQWFFNLAKRRLVHYFALLLCFPWLRLTIHCLYLFWQSNSFHLLVLFFQSLLRFCLLLLFSFYFLLCFIFCDLFLFGVERRIRFALFLLLLFPRGWLFRLLLFLRFIVFEGRLKKLLSWRGFVFCLFLFPLLHLHPPPLLVLLKLGLLLLHLFFYLLFISLRLNYLGTLLRIHFLPILHLHSLDFILFDTHILGVVTVSPLLKTLFDRSSLLLFLLILFYLRGRSTTLLFNLYPLILRIDLGNLILFSYTYSRLNFHFFFNLHLGLDWRPHFAFIYFLF